MNLRMCQQGGMHVGCADLWLEERMKKIKIWKMNECDWYASEDLEGAKRAMLETIGPPAEDQTEAEFFEEYLEDPYELDDAALDTLKFCEEEYDDEDDLDERGEPKRKGGEKRTFREQLAKMIAAGDKFPCYFASTEY